MKVFGAILGLLASCVPYGAFAQDEGSSEIIVTAQRRESSSYSSAMPAVGIRRTADFAIQETTITGDTRDASTRKEEIYQTLANAIRAAQSAGLQLAFGEYRVQPLTLQNYRDLSLRKDNRPDSEKLSFLIKAPLTKGGDAATAEARIAAFVKGLKPTGRALMETTDDLTFSVVAPDQYRAQIADAVSTDAKAMAARLGDGYAVEIEGLNQPVEWARSGLSEVFLYIPYRLTIVPRR